MDTLHARLEQLADDAPTGGAPPSELWTRGRRAHRRRSAVLAVASLVVLGTLGAGIGLRLDDGDDDRSSLASGGPAGVALPIEYPVGEELPDLGDAAGPLAAVWLVTRSGQAPEVVGLVAETGVFGTLPLDLPEETDPDNPASVRVALSADGRRLALPSPTDETGVVVHDLVSGKSEPLEISTRQGYTWVGATRLVGHVAGGSDGDGWAWEPGTEPERVDPYSQSYAGTDLAVAVAGGDPGQCESTLLQDLEVRGQNPGDDWAGSFRVPVLCDVLGITRDEVLLGHWNSDRAPGGWDDPDDGNGTVVALDTGDADVVCPETRPVAWTRCELDAPEAPRVVALAGAPTRVALATDLIARALEAAGGAS